MYSIEIDVNDASEALIWSTKFNCTATKVVGCNTDCVKIKGELKDLINLLIDYSNEVCNDKAGQLSELQNNISQIKFETQ